MSHYKYGMSQPLSLSDLAEATGIEARTIRSYIERGLLPSADARGRGASYSGEHLSRLHVIQALRRARPGITLSDIRIHLQQLTPEQLRSLASGSITAGVLPEIARSRGQADDQDVDDANYDSVIPRIIDGEAATQLTGVERLVCLLREVSGLTSSAPQANAVGWTRISITPDIELSIRAEFGENQLAAFRGLADLLRHLLQQPDAMTKRGA
jgi:DNA-binding transcriptional MerR regulator